jgi:wyosine [tRNA(Phe)-imidazoG37] synthetase (radical SAM superfamily)
MCVEVDLSPDGRCQFDCVYCAEQRHTRPAEAAVDLPALLREFSAELESVLAGGLWQDDSPAGFRHVAISGGGEPTLNPAFADAVTGILHLRAVRRFPFFKTVLLTNGVALDSPEVSRVLRMFCRQDEVWIKLDAGTAAGMERVNRPCEPAFDRVVENIIHLGRQRPVVIQCLFPRLAGAVPSAAEVEAHARLLRHLADSGAEISQVQVFSVTQPPADRSAACTHLPLRNLSEIARTLRAQSRLPVEVS